MTAPPSRARFAVGVALAAALGAWLVWRFTGQAVRHETADVERRQAVVSLQALSSLVARTAAEPEAHRVFISLPAKIPGRRPDRG